MKRLREININTPEYTDTLEQPVDEKNLLRQEKYISFIPEKEGQKIVELGCGVSYFAQMATKKGSAWGLDHARKTLEKMFNLYPNVNYIVGEATKTPFTNNFFDVVVSGEVLEHIEKPQELIDEMARICKPNGLLILSTPHLEFDDPEHIWEFEEKDLQEMMGKYGLVETETIHSDKFPGRSYMFAVCKKR